MHPDIPILHARVPKSRIVESDDMLFPSLRGDPKLFSNVFATAFTSTSNI
jgi:hypothetical protein